MGERKQNQNFEFKFSINDNIICQRFFSVDKFNKNAKNSQTIKTECDSIVENIKSKVKEVSLNRMNEYSYFYDEEPDTFDTNGENDYFYFYVKHHEVTLYSRIFPAYVYPTKIRKNIDIRKEIPEIIHNIQTVLSKRDHELDFNLDSFYVNPPSFV